VVARTPAGLLTLAVNLPLPASPKYSPPACQKNVDQYHETYPRVVAPGTASPYVSALPSPSGSPVVNAFATVATSCQVFGGCRLGGAGQPVAEMSVWGAVAAAVDAGVGGAARSALLLGVWRVIRLVLKLPSWRASSTATAGSLWGGAVGGCLLAWEERGATGS